MYTHVLVTEFKLDRSLNMKGNNIKVFPSEDIHKYIKST